VKNIAKQARLAGLVAFGLMVANHSSEATIDYVKHRLLTPLSQFALAEPGHGEMKKSLRLWATYYHVHGTKSVENGYSLLTPRGEHLGASLSRRDWCYAALQGTIRVESDSEPARVFNFAGRHASAQVDCSGYFSSLSDHLVKKIGRARFGPAIGPFGDGVQGRVLVPYRSIAVDRRHIPYGSVVYIPEARGVKITLPSGQVVAHDGYFLAADTGSAIKQGHIDVFTGNSAKNPFQNVVKSKASAVFTAYLVNNVVLQSGLEAMHRVGG